MTTTHLSPDLSSLAELVPSRRSCAGVDKNRSFAAFSRAARSVALATASESTASFTDTDLSNALRIGLELSDICLWTFGADCEVKTGRFLVKSGATIVSVLTVPVMVSLLSFLWACLDSCACKSGCNALALCDLRTPSRLAEGVGSRGLLVEALSFRDSWHALADFWTSLSRKGLLLKCHKREMS